MKIPDKKRVATLRSEIDQINLQLVHLFIKRLKKAKQIYKIKKRHGLPLFNKTRQAEMFQKNLKKMPNIKTKKTARAFLRCIFAQTLKELKRL